MILNIPPESDTITKKEKETLDDLIAELRNKVNYSETVFSRFCNHPVVSDIHDIVDEELKGVTRKSGSWAISHPESVDELVSNLMFTRGWKAAAQAVNIANPYFIKQLPYTLILLPTSLATSTFLYLYNKEFGSNNLPFLINLKLALRFSYLHDISYLFLTSVAGAVISVYSIWNIRKPLIQLLQKPSRIKEYIPGTDITYGSAYRAAALGHDSKEDGYWGKIEVYLKEEVPDPARIFITKLIDLVTIKSIGERVVTLADEVNGYFTQTNIRDVSEFMSRFTKTRFSNHHIPSEQDILVMKKLGIIYSYMNTGQDDDIREIYLKVTEILDNKAKYTVHLVGMANQEKTTEILCGIVSASIRGDEETLRKLIPIKKISDDVAEIAKKLIGEFKREEQNPIEKRTREKIIYLMKRISEEGIKASPQTELRELKMLAEIYAYYQQTMDRTWYMKMSSYENLTDNYVVDKLNTFLNRIKIITGTYQRGIYQAKVGVCRDYIAVDLDYEENYYLSIQALDTELDPYLREGAIGIKLCDTTHNLLTLSKEPSRKRQQEYKYTALSDIFYREDYELFRLIFDPRAQKWINSWGRKNLRRFQGTTTIEYIPPI